MSEAGANLARHHAAGSTDRGRRSERTVEEEAEDQGVGRGAKGCHDVSI